MWTRLLISLIGAVFVYQSQVVLGEIYISELTVESNVTLDATTILDSWAVNEQFTVSDTITVTLVSREVVAVCLVVGPDYNCNCTQGYMWSNEVCYGYGCCGSTTCTKNVSLVSPLCVPVYKVHINGTVQHTGVWDNTQTNTLSTHLLKLNGVNGTIDVKQGMPTNIGTFLLDVYVKLNNSRFQEILDEAKTALGASYIIADTHGMVVITAPTSTVKYLSNQTLNCYFDEPTSRSGWNLSRTNERFELNTGKQVILTTTCGDPNYPSCVNVSLTNVTGALAGTYECGFIEGSIRHTASAALDVALLPDSISMTIDPLIADCSGGQSLAEVTVTATIPSTTANYNYTWKYNDVTIQSYTPTNGLLTPQIKHAIKCTETKQNIEITFQNRVAQTKVASLGVEVLRATDIFCIGETADEVVWPKTPVGATVRNPTCPPGRVGYKERTCLKEGTAGKWLSVLSNCVNEELSKVKDAAKNFLSGVGATQEVALNIFEGMKNSSQLNSGSQDMADVSASVDVLSTMASATTFVTLGEEVFPDLVSSASNMLNSNWSGVNDTIRHGMSSMFLQSVEDLVKNIEVNASTGFNSTNLDLQFCTTDDCAMSVASVGVNFTKSQGLLKVMGMQNMMGKLKNSFGKTERTELLLSATLVNNSDSNVTIQMAFPTQHEADLTPICVFWDTKKMDWSDVGCTVNTTGNDTLCECSHLTAFSVLMSRGNVGSNGKDLDMITNIGLGVSACCLILFLAVEFMVWSAVTKTNLSYFRHTSVVNIAVFRLLADVSFLVSMKPEELSDTMCLTTTVCKHLFYLAMFTWMLCLSILLVHQLIFVFSPLRKRVFMYLSSILGYLCPIALVGCSYVYYKYTEKPYYDPKLCWLVYEKLLVGSIHAFLLPVGTIVLGNLFSMVVVIVTLVKTSVPDSSKANDKETAKSILKVVVFLTPVFGVTWIVGFGLLLLDATNPLYKIAEYAFTILNSFQGLFIFLVGCFGEQKVREELLRILKVKSGQNDTVSKSTSTAITKAK